MCLRLQCKPWKGRRFLCVEWCLVAVILLPSGFITVAMCMLLLTRLCFHVLHRVSQWLSLWGHGVLRSMGVGALLLLRPMRIALILWEQFGSQRRCQNVMETVCKMCRKSKKPAAINESRVLAPLWRRRATCPKYQQGLGDHHMSNSYSFFSSFTTVPFQNQNIIVVLASNLNQTIIHTKHEQ